MSSWVDKLVCVSNRKPKRPPTAFFVRPKKKETIDWLLDTAARYRVSVNTLIDAILDSERERIEEAK